MLGIVRTNGAGYLQCRSIVVDAQLLKDGVVGTASSQRWVGFRLINYLHGTVVLDDSDHQRAKQTSRVFGAQMSLKF